MEHFLCEAKPFKRNSVKRGSFVGDGTDEFLELLSGL